MDTVYYNLTARRVRVSGGPDLLKFSPAPAEAPAGEVLDFQRCRRKLETKAALAQPGRRGRKPGFGNGGIGSFLSRASPGACGGLAGAVRLPFRDCGECRCSGRFSYYYINAV